MPGGSCRRLSELPEPARALVEEARRAVLGTVDERARPHLVPVCFAIRGGEIVTAVDEKPKTTKELVRVRNIEAHGRATLLVDRWDEDWRRLGWAMIRAAARIEAPGSADDELRARYEQYRAAPPSGVVIALRPEAISWWTSE